MRALCIFAVLAGPPAEGPAEPVEEVEASETTTHVQEGAQRAPRGGEGPVTGPPGTGEGLRSPSLKTQTPRISGTYFGMTIWPGLAWAHSPNQEIDQSAVLPGGGGAMRLGQAVFPWMTIGLDASGGFYFNRDTFFTKGGLIIELGFYPVPRYPFSIRTGFGFGAGLILDDRTDVKGGVGGPQFMGLVRYEFFPQAERKRPKKPGGWVVGPEIGWRGFTPAGPGKDRPMSNMIYTGIWFGYYWGR